MGVASLFNICSTSTFHCTLKKINSVAVTTKNGLDYFYEKQNWLRRFLFGNANSRIGIIHSFLEMSLVTPDKSFRSSPVLCMRTYLFLVFSVLQYFPTFSTFQVDVHNAQVFLELQFADSLAINGAFYCSCYCFYVENKLLSCRVCLLLPRLRPQPSSLDQPPNYPTQVINYF